MADLRKSLGPWRGTSMMLNIVLGAGLLTLPGLAAREMGAGAPLIWLACGIAVIPLLIVFAVLGRTYPDSGGVAAIMKRAFGDFGYVPTTLLFFGAVAVGLPSIALTGGYYAASAFGGSAYVYAIVLLALATLVNLTAVETAGRINAMIASALIVVLVALAITGLSIVRPEFSDVATPAALTFERSTFAMAFVMVFFAFTGWEVAANLAGEFKNPKRDFPIALSMSFLLALVLYATLAFVVAGAGPSAATEAPFTTIFSARFGQSGATAVALIAVILIFANLSAAIWAVSRMVFSAASKRLLPRALSGLQGERPVAAVCVTSGVLLTIIVLTSLGFFELGTLFAMAGLNFLLLYAASAIALLRLSSNPMHRVAAAISVLLVAAITLTQDLHLIYYPLIPIIAGLALCLLRCGGRTGKYYGFGRLEP